MKLLTPEEIKDLKNEESIKLAEIKSSIVKVDSHLSEKKSKADEEFATYHNKLEKQFFARKAELDTELQLVTNQKERAKAERNRLLAPLRKEEKALNKKRAETELVIAAAKRERKKTDSSIGRLDLKLKHVNEMRAETQSTYDDVKIRERRLLEREDALIEDRKRFNKEREQFIELHRNEIKKAKALDKSASEKMVEALSIKESYMKAMEDTKQ